MKNLKALFGGLALLLCQSTAHAAVIPGVYQLFDHPDAHLTDFIGGYGLRIDSLDKSRLGPVFSVSSNGAEVHLTWDGGSTALIEGNVYNHYTDSLWHVVHVIENIFDVAEGFVTNDESDSVMTLTDTAGGGTEYIFNNKSDGNNSFVFLEDSFRCEGFTECGPIVSRGWVKYEGKNYGNNDWIVYAELKVVPVPAAVWLFTSGLIGLLGLARRRHH